MAHNSPSSLKILLDIHDEGLLTHLDNTLEAIACLKQISGVIIWNSLEKNNSGEKVCSFVAGVSCTLPMQYVQYSHRVLESIPNLADLLSNEPSSDVLFVDGSVTVTQHLIDHFVEKRKEYENEILVTAGSRLFPHAPFEDPVSFWQGGKFKRTYSKHDLEDRQVHVLHFDNGCFLFPTKYILEGLTLHQPPDGVSVAGVGDYWNSFVACHHLNLAIWKIELPQPLELQPTTCYTRDHLPERSQIYLHHIAQNWPPSILAPLVPSPTNHVPSVEDIWEKGFRGFNISSRPIPLDYAAAKFYGASVVRIGATDGTHDLSYLAKNTTTIQQDEDTLLSGLPTLRKCILSAAKVGLKVILTLTNLPGRRFLENDDFKLWSDFEEYSKRIAKLWGQITKELLDIRHHIAGYDVINEPSTPTDKTISSECPLSYDCDIKRLCEFYDIVIKAIREHDPETMIILESSYWAGARTFPLLEPYKDERVAYSFHFYEPKIYTDRVTNPQKFSYPGGVPPYTVMEKWPDSWLHWDKERIRETVLPVAQWQKLHKIPASRIFVGEFGVCREVPGAAKYLEDAMSVFNEHGWSWCVFSFRDDEWDGMDYELGDEIDNQLYRSETGLIKLISKQLK